MIYYAGRVTCECMMRAYTGIVICEVRWEGKMGEYDGRVC